MTLEVVQRAVSEIRPYDRNPRKNDHAVSAVAMSIEQFGFRSPIVVDEDGVILAGHTRYKAALQLGLEAVPVHVATGLSDAKKRAYRIADNKVAEAAEWDKAALATELTDLRALDFDLSLTGFGDDELIDLLEPMAGRKDPDAAPPVPDAPTARVGDLWFLGRHRVVCGDSCDPEVLRRLCGDRAADAAWTDPPYNVDYSSRAGKIANDAMADAKFVRFLGAAFVAMAGVMRAGASIYIAHADGPPALAFRQAFRDAGFKLSGCLVWRKSSFTLSRSDYQWQHEPILYGWKAGAAHRWFGGRKQSTVSLYGADTPFTQMDDGRWRIEIGDTVLVVSGDAEVESLVPSVLHHEKPRSSDDHPTMKPVSLVEQTLRNSARPGDVVLDAFGGSGTTLIAAERLGMSARLVELDPKFIDVIVRRWEEYTGDRARLEKGDRVG